MNYTGLEKQSKELQIAELELFIKSVIDSREMKRALSVKMSLEGKTCEEISKILCVKQSFIYYWRNIFKTKGIEGIRIGYKGSIGYLTDDQTHEVIGWLKAKSYWNMDELIDYISKHYSVIYKSKQSYYHLFSLAKISGQKSQKSNPKFAQELVEKKKKEIQKVLAENKDEIESGEIIVLFLDECHLLNGDLTGYVWGETESRVEVPIKNEKERQTYFGALNYKTKKFHIEGYCSGDGESTVKFAKHLQNEYKDKRMIFIWDGASYHKFGEFKEFLEEINNGKKANEWPITCILFAPNAPQQNPVEDVWLQGKNFLRKYWYLCKSFKIVKFLFEFCIDDHKFDFPKIHQYSYF